MKITDDVRGMIRAVVKESRDANPRIVLVPDPDEVLIVHCVNCTGKFRRPRRVIERDNLKQGFWACSHGCKKVQKAKGERVFVPVRER